MTHNNDNFEALPIEVINSTMTESQLKVMEVLFLYNGLDKTNENGHFYISNTDMMEKAGIGSKTTLNKVLSFFNNNRFIERKSGNIVNRQASEYILNVDEVINWSIEHPCKNASRRNTHNVGVVGSSPTRITVKRYIEIFYVPFFVIIGDKFPSDNGKCR